MFERPGSDEDPGLFSFRAELAAPQQVTATERPRVRERREDATADADLRVSSGSGESAIPSVIRVNPTK